jgi:hypothetical protein
MTVQYEKKHFNKEELGWAISVMEAEHDKVDRNTPEKMAKLIESNFDVSCAEQDIANFFEMIENYESESNRIETGYTPGFEPNQFTGVDDQRVLDSV